MRFLFLFFYNWLILPQVYSRPGKFMKVALLFFSLALTRAQDTTYNCNGWSQFTIGSYLVENNVWGQGNITDFTQCIYRTGSGDDIHFGWNWDWPGGSSNVKAYPEVMFGKKPWSSSSTNTALPIKIQNLDEFYVVYDLDMVAAGSYNLAFEFWVTTDSMSSETGITTEVMIWMDNNLISPAGNIIGTVTFDGLDYNLYRADWDSWTYFAFLSAEPQYNGVLGVHHFVDHLVSQGMLNSDEYFADFELGNEVVYGTGQTEIRQYEIYVNSNPLSVASPESIPELFKLLPAYPNPFNPSTKIDYVLSNSNIINLSVYDIYGRQIEELLNEYHRAGEYSITWDGSRQPSGIYFIKMMSNKINSTQKVVLLK